MRVQVKGERYMQPKEKESVPKGWWLEEVRLDLLLGGETRQDCSSNKKSDSG